MAHVNIFVVTDPNVSEIMTAGEVMDAIEDTIRVDYVSCISYSAKRKDFNFNAVERPYIIYDDTMNETFTEEGGYYLLPQKILSDPVESRKMHKMYLDEFNRAYEASIEKADPEFEITVYDAHI